MAVKFYSDLLNTYFDTQEDAEQAEAEFKVPPVKEDKTPAVEEPKNEKKALAKKISELDDKVAQAQAEYEKRKDLVVKLYEEKVAEAKKIVEDAEEDALKILKEEKKKVNDAVSERYSAICEFTDKYGCYTRQYSGKRAYEEFVKYMNEFDNIFKTGFRL